MCTTRTKFYTCVVVVLLAKIAQLVVYLWTFAEISPLLRSEFHNDSETGKFCLALTIISIGFYLLGVACWQRRIYKEKSMKIPCSPEILVLFIHIFAALSMMIFIKYAHDQLPSKGNLADNNSPNRNMGNESNSNEKDSNGTSLKNLPMNQFNCYNSLQNCDVDNLLKMVACIPVIQICIVLIANWHHSLETDLLKEINNSEQVPQYELEQQNIHPLPFGNVFDVYSPFNVNPPAYDDIELACNVNPLAYDANPPAYDANPPAYDSNPPAYDSNPPAYDANLPAYDASSPKDDTNTPTVDDIHFVDETISPAKDADESSDYFDPLKDVNPPADEINSPTDDADESAEYTDTLKDFNQRADETNSPAKDADESSDYFDPLRDVNPLADEVNSPTDDADEFAEYTDTLKDFNQQAVEANSPTNDTDASKNYTDIGKDTNQCADEANPQTDYADEYSGYTDPLKVAVGSLSSEIN